MGEENAATCSCSMALLYLKSKENNEQVGFEMNGKQGALWQARSIACLFTFGKEAREPEL